MLSWKSSSPLTTRRIQRCTLSEGIPNSPCRGSHVNVNSVDIDWKLALVLSQGDREYCMSHHSVMSIYVHNIKLTEIISTLQNILFHISGYQGLSHQYSLHEMNQMDIYDSAFHILA